MTSPHFNDFAPEQTTPDVPEFESSMQGPGRWFVMEDDDGSLFGVLWTDDKDALGLLGTELTSSEHQQAGVAEIRRAKANGYTATETFDTLLTAYAPEGYGEGQLEDLLAEL